VFPEALAPPHFACVVAADQNRGIGRDNRLPWPRLRGDLAHLKQVTTSTRGDNARNAVIMGRRTWESIPPRFRPLPGRLNLVVSRTAPGLELATSDAQLTSSLDQALAQAMAQAAELIFVLGGGQLFAEAVTHPNCQLIYYTRISGVFSCDTFFPPFEGRFVLQEALPPHTEADTSYQIERWRARTADELPGASRC
jgi:dihydrofolate reductase